jgi:hypothetical protein
MAEREIFCGPATAAVITPQRVELKQHEIEETDNGGTLG